MTRLLAMCCALVVMAVAHGGVGYADDVRAPVEPTQLSPGAVLDLLSAVPDAVSADVGRPQGADGVLRAMSTLRFNEVDLSRVDESLLRTAREWNRLASSRVVPTYAELERAYKNNSEFGHVVDTIAGTLSSCSSTVIAVIIIAIGVWPLMIQGYILACVWQLPSLSAWYICTANGTQRVSSAVLTALKWIVTECVEVGSAYGGDAFPERAGIRPA